MLKLFVAYSANAQKLNMFGLLYHEEESWTKKLLEEISVKYSLGWLRTQVQRERQPSKTNEKQVES